MKLESKLGISTGVLILALFVSALTAHLRLARVMQLAIVVDGERLPFIIAMENMRGRLANTVVAVETSMVLGPQSSGHAAIRAAGREAQSEVDTDLSLLRNHDSRLDLGADEGRLQTVAQQIQDLKLLERQLEDLNDLATPEGTAQARTLLESKTLPLAASLYQGTADIIRTQTAVKDEQIAMLRQGDRVVLLTLWTATILGALVGGIVSFVLVRRITRGVALVAERAGAIASGDLTGADLGIDSDDQIGELARAMQQMQHSLADIIGTVARTASTFTASALSMSSATDHVHRRVDQQTQQTQQAATAMQEMSASIAEVSRHTHSAAETARSAAQIAHEGGDIVKQMLGSMHCIATAVSETSSTVGLLGEDSRRISQIVTVIDEIARKTNLLALNAAIEAARAGEQGRGFAVVAGEVRRLAESTAQATGEISSMIQGIQDRTRIAIASMASGTVTVEEGVATTNQAGEALGRIIGMAERVDRMITQIAIAASQQADAANQSSSSLDSIHTLSQDNLAETATTTAGIESLRATAAALERQVERFRLDTPQPGLAARRASPRPRPIPYPTPTRALSS
jgi:methyl-accepting chemotaxis protein